MAAYKCLWYQSTHTYLHTKNARAKSSASVERIRYQPSGNVTEIPPVMLARRLLLFKAPDSNRDNYQAVLLIDRGNYIDEMEIHHLCATLPGIGARRNLGGR